MLRKILAATALASAGLLLAACGGSANGSSGTSLSSVVKLPADQLASTAAQEGQLNWYTTFAADDVNKMISAFNKVYPKVKVNALRLSADQLPPRVITEQRGGEFNADVVSGDAPQVDQLINANALQPYCPADQQPLPNGQSMPKGYCGNVYVVTTAIVYNPGQLTKLGLQPPTSLQVLAQPQWKGHFSMDPSAVNLYEGLIDVMGHDKALALLKQLGQNQPKLVESHTLALTQVEAGEPAASASAYGYKAASEQKKNPGKVAFVNPNPLPHLVHPDRHRAQRTAPGSGRAVRELDGVAAGTAGDHRHDQPHLATQRRQERPDRVGPEQMGPGLGHGEHFGQPVQPVRQ